MVLGFSQFYFFSFSPGAESGTPWPHAFSRVLMTSKLFFFVIEAIHFAEIRPFCRLFFGASWNSLQPYISSDMCLGKNKTRRGEEEERGGARF